MGKTLQDHLIKAAKSSLICIWSLLAPILSAQGQITTLSPEAQISVLTIGPGTELSDRFGHNAFRVYDPTQDLDWTYNYGTYDFNTPHFYLKFVQGHLLYNLSVNYFDAFLQYYQRQNRWVKEQVLVLSAAQKNQLFDYLQWNAQPANRAYRYDFFFDNCATRIRDVLVHQLGQDLVYSNDFVTEPKTFRALIQEQVPRNTWGSLGMDVAIGAVVDRQASAWDFQFLPQYVMAANAMAQRKDSIGLGPLTQETKVLYAAQESKEPRFAWNSPIMILGLISILLLGITIKDWRRQQRTRWVDALVFGVTGTIGLLLMLLWWGTDHGATKMNYNLLWAMPLSLLFIRAIYNSNPKPWLGRYVLFLLLMLALMVTHQFSGVQSFAPTLWILWFGLTFRLGYLYGFLKKS